jgi:thiamine biosynthesis lipoprotein
MEKSSFHRVHAFSITDAENKAKGKSKCLFAFFCVMLLGILCGCEGFRNADAGQRAEKVSLTDVCMGTVVSFTLYPENGSDKSSAERLARSLLQEVRSLEETTLSRKLEASEVYQINQSAGEKEGHPLSVQLEDLLLRCQQMTKDSDGAFDVTIGPLVALWRMDERAAGEETGKLPGAEEIKAAMAFCGSSMATLQDGKITLQAGAMLDLGSVGKGEALDLLAKALEGQEVAGVFSLGGSILTYGDKPDGMPWKVGIANPARPEKTLGTLTLTGQWCVSTSGDYERYFMFEGERYHHLLDPATGYPARSGLRGVTILSESGFLSDALSTACFVLGKEKGMALAEKWQAGILAVDDDGEIVMNEKMKAFFSP